MKKKLVLNKETLRTLNDLELGGIAGGLDAAKEPKTKFLCGFTDGCQSFSICITV